MTKHGFAGCFTHRREHDAFRKKAAQLQESYRADPLVLTLEVNRFLKDWLTGHILGTDKRYGPYLLAKGVT